MRLDNYKKDAVNSESSDNNNIDLEERNESGATGDSSCQLRDIPIATIVSNKNEVSDQMVNQNNKLSWMKLDLGQPKQICWTQDSVCIGFKCKLFHDVVL